MMAVSNINYQLLIPPSQPDKKAIAVLNADDAKTVLDNVTGEVFVYCMNEETGTFAKCVNMVEVEDFYSGKTKKKKK